MKLILPIPSGKLKSICFQLFLAGNVYTNLRNFSISIEQELAVFEEQTKEHM